MTQADHNVLEIGERTFFDVDGSVLCMGRVYIFCGTGGLPKRIYLDKSHTIRACHPIILTARGTMPHTYCEGPVTVVVRRSDGITLQVVGPINTQ